MKDYFNNIDLNHLNNDDVNIDNIYVEYSQIIKKNDSTNKSTHPDEKASIENNFINSYNINSLIQTEHEIITSIKTFNCRIYIIDTTNVQNEKYNTFLNMNHDKNLVYTYNECNRILKKLMLEYPNSIFYIEVKTLIHLLEELNSKWISTHFDNNIYLVNIVNKYSNLISFLV